MISQSKGKNKEVFLMIALIVLAFGAGWRDMRWPDTDVYSPAFTYFTNDLYSFSLSDIPFGYREYGFYFLGVIVKTFTNDAHIYLTFIAGLSLFFLYKDLRKYSLFPLIGLCAYIARFFIGRNLVQIRSGLAYLIVLWGIKYVQEKKLMKYLLVVWIASWFHTSAWIALPFYFFSNWVNINKKIVLIGLGVAFIIGGFFQGPVSAFVTDNANDLNVVTYTQGIYVEQAKGLANPMIYFQCFLLLTYTYLEKSLEPITEYYRIIRDGYFYSTLILICFCSFTALSGRTSTMFATLEFSIIPSLIFLFNKKNHVVAYLVLSLALIGIMYMNLPPWAMWSL
ncbi:MAG: EpsG family protein [Prevotella sp.]|nr:EpsG family protein [Prevotella sp.]